MTTQSARATPTRLLPLLFAGGVLFAIAAAGIGRIVGPTGLAEPGARPVAARDLRFADRTDGGVDVFDTRDGSSVAVLPAGSNNFLRATMRVLAHQRMTFDGKEETPFRLTAWSDGRLTLEDPATGRSVGLEAFGADNEIVFARLLTSGRTP
jgi:putative photosynthetic complex assembly protein